MNREAFEIIRSANTNMAGLLKKVAKGYLKETQALIEIGKELARQALALMEVKGE